MRIEEVKTYSKAKKVGAKVSKQFQKKAGKIIMGWIDKLENEFITKKLIRNEPGNRADFRSEALTLINQEMGSKWNSEQVADNFQIKGYDKNGNATYEERPWQDRAYGPIGCRSTCVNSVNSWLKDKTFSRKWDAYKTPFNVTDFVEPANTKSVDPTAPKGYTNIEVQDVNWKGDGIDPFRIGMLYFISKKEKLKSGDPTYAQQVKSNLKPGTKEWKRYQGHLQALRNYDIGPMTKEKKRAKQDAEQYIRGSAFGSYNGGANFWNTKTNNPGLNKQRKRAIKYSKEGQKYFVDVRRADTIKDVTSIPIFPGASIGIHSSPLTRSRGIIDKHDDFKDTLPTDVNPFDGLTNKGPSVWDPRNYGQYLFGKDTDQMNPAQRKNKEKWQTGVADQVVQQLSWDAQEWAKGYGQDLLRKMSLNEPSGDPKKDGKTMASKIQSAFNNATRGEQSSKLKKESITEYSHEEGHHHVDKDIISLFVKNVLKLNASEQQIEKFMNQLDVTDIISIKQAMHSGNFYGLKLGEQKLEEYITPAQKEKGPSQPQSPQQTQSTQLAPIAPEQKPGIAGNNPNPEAPPTGASQSTRKPVPTMKRSEVKRNAVVTNPDTGEEFLVTNDMVASQMMQRAKRVGGMA